MTNKKPNKISIRPIGNAQAIASTLGIGNQPSQSSTPAAPQAQPAAANESKPAVIIEPGAEKQGKLDNSERGELKRSINSPVVSPRAKSISESKISVEEATLPLLFEIKRKLPGKELFVLCLLYKQKNSRGLIQTTVSGLMNLYYSVFNDTIKDDTVRRSLKRLADAALVKTKSIPGHNAGYVYEIDDLLTTDAFTPEEKEEFSVLVSFVESKLEASAR